MRPFHPIAAVFPLIIGSDFDQLVASIKASEGLREPIVIHEDMILDGRNRARACDAAGIEARYTMLPAGVDPVAFVVDKNLRRRHLNDNQRRMVAARIADLPSHRPKADPETPAIGGTSVAKAAEFLAVDHAGVERARTVVTKGVPELQDAVDNGRLTVRLAADLAALPLEAQRQIVSSADPKAIKAAGKKVREAEEAKRKERRKAKEKALGEVQAPTGRFGLIVEDYEWDYEVWSRESGMGRHAANHYPVSEDAHTAEEIVKRTADRFAVADENCILAMWATVPHLAIAIDVLRMRGFRYVSHYIWGKDKIGTGHWNRNKHEILLLGIKGEIPCPSQGDQWASLIMAAVGEHSAKPECFMEMLEVYFPTLPKLELNARRQRKGWAAWGNEIGFIPAIGSSTGDPAPRATVAKDDPADDLTIPPFLDWPPSAECIVKREVAT